jgi:hypothetical protein
MATVTPSSCASPLGRIVAVKTGSVAPISVTFDGQPIKNMGLCTQLRVNQSVIAQFQSTLGNYIYITPFGDKPGDIEMSFIVNKECNASQEALNAIDFYIKRRLQPTLPVLIGSAIYYAQTAPIIIAIGSLALRSFVTGLSIDATTSQSVIVSATLRMTGWPK